MHIVLLHVCSKIWKVLLKYINIISCSFVFLSNQKIYNHKNRGERGRERLHTYVHVYHCFKFMNVNLPRINYLSYMQLQFKWTIFIIILYYKHRPNETNFITVNYYLVYGVNIMHIYKKVNECLMINNEKKTRWKTCNHCMYMKSIYTSIFPWQP